MIPCQFLSDRDEHVIEALSLFIPHIHVRIHVHLILHVHVMMIMCKSLKMWTG